ncbi:MAG: sugar phosphate isomerase/epimerase [Acidobacteriota bacterium]|nr:sugar phosphate isomerase/epimerase [Acidobacteriota bacterium]
MEIGVSTRLFMNQRLSSHILDSIHKAGIGQLEIFAARQHLDYCDANHVRDVAQWFSDHAMNLHSVHAPLFQGIDSGHSGGLAISPSYVEKRLRIESMDEIKRAIEIADRLPFRYLVVHLGRPDDEYDLRKFDAAFTSLEHLGIFARQRGVQILVENGTSPLDAPIRVLEFIQYTRLEVKVCFDAGHAHLSGGVLPALEMLKPHVAALHLHDNRKDADDHLLPFEGSIDWPETVPELRKIERAAALVEVNDRAAGTQEIARVQSAVRKLHEL